MKNILVLGLFVALVGCAARNTTDEPQGSSASHLEDGEGDDSSASVDTPDRNGRTGCNADCHAAWGECRVQLGGSPSSCDDALVGCLNLCLEVRPRR